MKTSVPCLQLGIGGKPTMKPTTQNMISEAYSVETGTHVYTYRPTIDGGTGIFVSYTNA